MPQASDNESYEGLEGAAQKIPYSYSSAISSYVDDHSLTEISEKLSELSLPSKASAKSKSRMRRNQNAL